MPGPGGGGSGEGEEVAAVGGDGRQEVRGGGSGGVGEDGGDEGAGKLGEFEVGEGDQAFAMEQDGERGGLNEDADVGCDGQAGEAVGPGRVACTSGSTGW